MAGFYSTEPYIKRTYGVEEASPEEFAAAYGSSLYGSGSGSGAYGSRSNVGSGLHYRSRPSSAAPHSGHRDALSGGSGGRLDPRYDSLTTPVGVGAATLVDSYPFGNPRAADSHHALVRTPHSNFGVDEYMPTHTDRLFEDDPALIADHAYNGNPTAGAGGELTLHPSANPTADAYDRYSLYNPVTDVEKYSFEGNFEYKLEQRKKMEENGVHLTVLTPWFSYAPWVAEDYTARSGRRSQTIRYALKALSMVLVFLSLWLINGFFTVAALILLASDVPRRIRKNLSEKTNTPFDEFHKNDLIPEAVCSFLMAWCFDSWLTFVCVIGVAAFVTAALIQMYWIFNELWMVPGHIRYYGRKFHREASLENFMPLALNLGDSVVYHTKRGWRIAFRFFQSKYDAAISPRLRRSPEPPRRHRSAAPVPQQRHQQQDEQVPYGARAASPVGTDYDEDAYTRHHEMTPTPPPSRRTASDRPRDAAYDPTPTSPARQSSLSRPHRRQRQHSENSGEKEPEHDPLLHLAGSDVQKLKLFLASDPNGPRERHLGSITVSHRLIQDMKPGDLVEDSIIDGHVELLMRRNIKTRNTMPEVPKCLFLPTCFFEFLKSDQRHQAWEVLLNHDTRGEILTYDRVFIPVNAEGRHWSMLEIDFAKKCYIYYDSAAGDGVSELDHKIVVAVNALLVWGAKQRKYNFPKLNTRFLSRREFPQQANEFDCGIYIILYMIMRSENLEFRLELDKLSNYRARIALNLIDGDLKSSF